MKPILAPRPASPRLLAAIERARQLRLLRVDVERRLRPART